MSFQPTPRQILALWRMLFLGERPLAGDLAKRLGKRGRVERDQLVKAGVIELLAVEKPGRGKQSVVTEKGWAWAQENLDAEISQSKLAAEVLEAVLKHLKRYMKTQGLALSEIIRPNPTCSGADLETLVREVYFSLSGGRPNVRIRLSELRNGLQGVPRPDLDSTLLRMQGNGLLSLYGLDDPKEIRIEDKQSAINIAGFEKHIVYLGG
jgi:hypothetical protein